jgi:hypothetical protein
MPQMASGGYDDYFTEVASEPSIESTLKSEDLFKKIVDFGNNSGNSVTRMDQFPPMGDCLLRSHFFKIRKWTNFLASFCSRYIFTCINFDHKRFCDKFWAIFSKTLLVTLQVMKIRYLTRIS